MNNAELTRMLVQWFGGDRSSEQALFGELYPYLKKIAKKQLRDQGNLTMQSTELANEAFFELSRSNGLVPESRGHFFALSATMIRRIVIDHVRARGAQKRIDKALQLPLHLLDESALGAASAEPDWLELDIALNELSSFDTSSATLIELRFFMGMTSQEIAKTLDTSVSTVERQWRFARAWLHKRLVGLSNANAT